MSLFLRFFLLLFLLVGALPARAELVAVPALSARVTDLTGTLDAGQKAALEEKLSAFEAARGSQVAVLMVPGTKPEAIEQFSIRVAEAWKIGRKGQDDGVILLVAKDERKMRIEVGRGLEGALPDAVCRRIIAEDIAPRFKAGDWAGGLNAGVDRIHKSIAGEALPPPASGSSDGATGEGSIPGGDGEIAGIVAAVVLGNFLARFLGRLLAGLGSGAVVAYLAMLLTGSLLAAGVVGFFAFLFVLAPGSGGGYWSGGSGGGFGSGGSSDGGWSGGGGDFGGGGASGDW